MDGMLALTIVCVVFAIGDFISDKTHAIIPVLLFASVTFLILFWTGAVPTTLFTDAGLIAISNMMTGIFIVNMGTLLDFKEFVSQWKTVVLGLAIVIVGGILILWIERAHEKSGKAPRVASMDDMTWKDAVGVGLMQCFALIPGTSRSGATIIGGLVLGLSRKAATEFSFFLAIPTIFGATVYDLYKSREVLSVDVLPSVAIGFVVSFFSAILVVRWLLRFVSTNDFRVFGWYRIVFGIVVLALCAAGLADF